MQESILSLTDRVVHTHCVDRAGHCAGHYKRSSRICETWTYHNINLPSMTHCWYMYIYIYYLDSRSLWAEVSSMYQGVCGKLSWCKWRRHDDDMTTTCPWHGDSIAMALRRHGDDTATTWRRLGDGIATTWRRHGDHMATTWRRHGDDMATTWRRGQDDNDDGENDDDGDDEDDGDDHETELYRVCCRHSYTYGYGLMMPKRACHNQISFFVCSFPDGRHAF